MLYYYNRIYYIILNILIIYIRRYIKESTELSASVTIKSRVETLLAVSLNLDMMVR